MSYYYDFPRSSLEDYTRFSNYNDKNNTDSEYSIISKIPSPFRIGKLNDTCNTNNDCSSLLYCNSEKVCSDWGPTDMYLLQTNRLLQKQQVVVPQTSLPTTPIPFYEYNQDQIEIYEPTLSPIVENTFSPMIEKFGGCQYDDDGYKTVPAVDESGQKIKLKSSRNLRPSTITYKSGMKSKSGKNYW